MWERTPIFWDYITTDDEGTINGIQGDAPQDMKEAYQKWLKEEEERKKTGMIL